MLCSRGKQPPPSRLHSISSGRTPPDRRRNVLNLVLKTYKPYILFPLLTGGVAASQNQPRNTNINSADGVVVFYSSVSATTSHPEYSGRTPPDRRRNVLNLALKTYKPYYSISPPQRRGVSDTKQATEY